MNSMLSAEFDLFLIILKWQKMAMQIMKELHFQMIYGVWQV